MLVTVVLCTHNGAPLIDQQLAALADQQLEGAWEILVVDNDSTDNTPELVENWAQQQPRIRMIRATEKHNLAYARNVAVAASEAEYLAFADDDDLVAPRWLAAIVAALDQADLVASNYEYERLNGPDLLAGRSHFQHGKLAHFCGVPVVGGACGVRRSLWNQLGGNDEAWPFSGEDLDFAIRAARGGAKVRLATDAVYHIRLRSGLVATFRQARKTGRAHVGLTARHCAGLHSWRPSARMVWWITTRAAPALMGHHRELWARRVGVELGRVEQSVRERLGYHLGSAIPEP